MIDKIGLVIGNRAVGANNRVVTRITIPIGAFGKVLPLRHRAVISDFRKAFAIGKRAITDLRDGSAEAHALQLRTIAECRVTDLRETVRHHNPREAFA